MASTDGNGLSNSFWNWVSHEELLLSNVGRSGSSVNLLLVLLFRSAGKNPAVS